jgi:hypothetical protein
LGDCLPSPLFPALIHTHAMQGDTNMRQVREFFLQVFFSLLPHEDEGLITFIKCWQMHSNRNGRVRCAESPMNAFRAGMTPDAGSLGSSTTLRFHKRLWCSHTLRRYPG